MARQAVIAGSIGPIYLNETTTRSAILPVVYVNETVYPFSQISWNLTTPALVSTPFNYFYNLELLSSAAVQNPFAQYLWSLTQPLEVVKWSPLNTIPELIAVSIGASSSFSKTDLIPTVPWPVPDNTIPLLLAGIPFNQLQWPLTLNIPTSVWNPVQNTDVLLAAIPFNKEDWPLTQQILASNGYVFPTDLNKFPPVGIPFNQLVWSLTQPTQASLSSQVVNNLVFYPVTVVTDLHQRPFLITLGRLGHLGGLS